MQIAGRNSPAAVVPSGTDAMAARLAEFASTVVSEYGFNNQVIIDALQANLKQQLGPEQAAYVNLSLGMELLKVGENEQAGEHFQSAITSLAAPSDPSVRSMAREARSLFGISCLRIAEQENCLAEHTPASCLLPIMPDSPGIHRHSRGSRLAVDAITDALQYDPDDLALRWLLNVAHMTLGEYPDGVPESWRIDPSVFDSDIEFPRFYDAAGYLGVNSVGLAGGVVVEDFDGDGYLDIMVSSVGYSDQLRLFHNEANGTFSDWTERAGLTGIVGGANLCHADYNNDGFPDVLVMRGGWQRDAGRQPNSLLRNTGKGSFDDVTQAAGMLTLRPRQAAAWGDFDGDGWLDLFVGNESTPPFGTPCELYHNNRDETFTECAMPLRVAVDGMCKGVAWGDYNNDGRPDLYISRNGLPNLLFRNDGPASAEQARNSGRSGSRWWIFTETAEQAGVADPIWSFPVWFWDYDNDGWEDLMVWGFDNSRSQLRQVAADYLGLPHNGSVPRLYRNRRDGTFEDVTQSMGLQKALLVMGCNFGDLDNDGYLDFYLGTGDPDFRTLIPNRMFRNDAASRFQDVTTAGGFGNLQKGHGIAFADLDNDGDQDIYADLGGFYKADRAHNALFENPGFGNRWVTLRLRGVQSNRLAIGARIRVDVDSIDGARSIFLTVGTGGSFGSASVQQEIGLGNATAINRISVTWPATGKTDVYEAVPLDRIVTIQEGNRGLVDVAVPQPLSLSPTRGLEPPPATCCEPNP
jgi:hypothetical protein